MLSGDKLRSLRILYKITEKEMAEAIGKSDRWVRVIESCKEAPTEEVYKAWLDACYGKKPIRKTKKG